MAAPKAIVIRGGIGGLAAAVALRKIGMAVTVFERAIARPVRAAVCRLHLLARDRPF
jgi:2-polyprenyl-6-methoxyphenol hydroxylase-like FAD-dependent oxidoreductase